MVILYIYSTCWCMKSMFYERQQLTRYENNYKALNLISTALGRNVYDKVSHLETTHDVCLKLCNTYEGSSEIKSSRKDTYNSQYQTFTQKPR
jgi:hypothetical protein